MYYMYKAILFFIICENVRSQVNQPCFTQYGDDGLCTPFRKCSNARESVLINHRPNICSFDNLEPVICCDKNNVLKNPIMTVDTSTNQFNEQESETKEIGAKAKQYCEKIWSESVTNLVNVTVLEEFPHVAALGYIVNSTIIRGCTGSLISEKFILTTGTCLTHFNLGHVKIISLGSSDLHKPIPDKVQSFLVNKVHRYPKTNINFTYHDIGLIELERPATITKYVKPVCLQVDKKIILNPFLVNIKWRPAFNKTYDELFKLSELKEYSYEECSEIYIETQYSPNGLEKDGQMCAGNKKAWDCKMDHGSPLQTKNLLNDGYTIVGIQSYSFESNCKQNYLPTVYTRVSNYIEWIESVVWPN